MTNEFTRRTALKYAGFIALAARGYLSRPGYTAQTRARGYGTDPDLLARPVTWPKTLDPDQLRSFRALCEIILPAEPPHPSAAAVGVQDFLDEWLSAPYPQMQADRALLLRGLEQLNKAMRQTHQMAFAEADTSNQSAIFDSLCSQKDPPPFARRLIELVCAGYYTGREGHAAIGYIGNVGRATFVPPSPEIVQHFERVLRGLPQRS